MTDDQKHKCVKILDHLLNDYPIASIFKDPVDLEAIPQYKKVIKTPIDISTVRKRVKNNKYTHLDQWKKDVYLIFKNAIQFNGTESSYGLAASYLKQATDKLIKKYLPNIEQTTKECLRLQKKLDRLLTPGPNQAPNLTPFIEYSKEQKSISRNIDNNETDYLTHIQSELERLVTNPDHALQVLYIIKEDNPEKYKGENVIDVNLANLKQSTIQELHRYLMRNK